MTFFLTLILFIGCTLASFDVGYVLKQDQTNETYFFEVWVGTMREKKLLLLDSLANSTAIMYDPSISRRSKVHLKQLGTIEMENNSSYSGNKVEDDLCLDDDEDICVQNFSFF